MSQEEAFNLLKEIVERVSSQASLKAKVADWSKAFQFKPSDADPFFLQIRGAEILVEKGVHSSPVATLVSSHRDLVEILTGRLDAFKAFFSGRLKVEGNIMEAQALNTILRHGIAQA